MRRFALLVLLLIPAARCAAAQPVRAAAPRVSLPAGAREERLLVDGARVSDARALGAPWRATGSAIALEEPGSGLVSVDEVGSGDFELEARLRLLVRKGAGAALVLGGSSIVLDAEERRVRAEGPLFGKRALELPELAKRLSEGRTFELALRRAGKSLELALDGQPVGKLALREIAVGRVGLLGGGGLECERLRVRGDLRSAPGSVRELQPAIDAAIARGIDYLLTRQQRDGSWGNVQRGFAGGQTALCAYTLLKCGLRRDHPALQRAFAWLDTTSPSATYSAGTLLMAYEALHDPARLPRMREIAKRLQSWSRGGAWGYPPPAPGVSDWEGWSGVHDGTDLSNTQYAVLGLRAAEAAGVELADAVWLDVVQSTLALLEEPRASTRAETGRTRSWLAGFRYFKGRDPNGSMTAAGIAVLSVAREALEQRLPANVDAASRRALQLATQWLAENFAIDKNPFQGPGWNYYYLYGLERVGTLLELERIGDHDWYAEGARFLLREQDKAGRWAEGVAPDAWYPLRGEPDSCFALLFLKRATRPARTPLPEEVFAPPKDESGAPVRLRALGRSSVRLWIDGFSAEVLERNGAPPNGLRVLSVEYREGERVLERVEGDAQRAWQGQSFAVTHVFDRPGEHELRAVVELAAPEAAPGARAPSLRVESPPRRIRIDAQLRPWMLACASRPARDLLPAAQARVTVSSELRPGKRGGELVDALECTRWLCAKDEAEPVLVLEFPKAVRGSLLVLHPACACADELGRFDRIERIALRLNRQGKPLELDAPADELEPIEIPLDKAQPINRLEVRIQKRARGGADAGVAGFCAVLLEK